VDIETERLILRRFTDGDTAFIVRLLNERSFIENIGDRDVRTVADALRYIDEGPGASYRRFGHGLYGVVLKETGQLIGMCGLLKRDKFEHADVGYAFLPEFWSKGYAREAVVATLGEARALAMKKVLAVVSPHNAASMRLLGKLGFAAAGRTTLSGPGDVVELFELML
jgi:ribosomal-protein-alanine N-acetyltransferase